MQWFSAYALIAIVAINKRILNAQGIEKQPFAIIVSAAQIVKISSIAFIYYVHVMFSILCAHIHPDQNALVQITLKIAEQKISIQKGEKMRMNQSVIGVFHVFRNGFERNKNHVIHPRMTDTV